MLIALLSDVNGISTQLELFYAYRLGNHIDAYIGPFTMETALQATCWSD